MKQLTACTGITIFVLQAYLSTAVPQNITFPTDLKLLDASHRKSEELIDKLYNPALQGSVKPRTYHNQAHKLFLNTSKKKHKTLREIYKANGQQLRYLGLAK